MKHFLIPQSERKVLLKEYRIRAIIVLMFMISLAFVIGIVALFPSFIIANIEESSQTATLDSLKKGKEKSGISAIEKEIASDRLLLTALVSKENDPDMTNIISGIVSLRGPVKITSMSISKQATSTIATVIQGIAPNRESLLKFKNALETSSASTTVDLPISSLAKSTNIQFSLQFTQTTQ